MEEISNRNLSTVKGKILFIPVFLILGLVIYLYSRGSLSTEAYIQIQKPLFFKLNAILAQYPLWMQNLTQLGDALVALSILSFCIYKAPKVWHSLLTASIFSLIISSSLKNLFAVPRPAAIIPHSEFHIIGKALTAHSSLPSGHSITIFTVISLLLLAFAPRNFAKKLIWYVCGIVLGGILVLTRVGMGAHYPMDTFVGACLGSISAVFGILFTRKWNIWFWMNIYKWYPVHLVLLFVCSILLLLRFSDQNLIIYIVAIVAVILSWINIVLKYVKERA